MNGRHWTLALFRNLAAATVLAALAIAPGAVAQSRPASMQPFVGTWKLNIPKSHMGFDGPNVVTPMRGPTFTWIFSATPYGLKQEVYDAYPAAAATRTLEVRTDGKAYPCLTTTSCLPGGGDPKDQTIGYWRLDDHMMARISYVKGQILEYDSYAISEDGKTFVVTAWKAGHPEWQNVQVFDKQP
jgi:hypothetical protein